MKTKILMGIPAPWMKGGILPDALMLVNYLEANPDFEIKTFYYGGKSIHENQSFFNRTLNTLRILFKYIQLLIIYKPQIIHLNSGFDRNSLLRDVPFSVVSKLLFKSLIFKVHGSQYELLKNNNRFLRLLIRIYFWGAKRVGLLSEYEKIEFINELGYSKKLIVVKNIVESVNETTYDRDYKDRDFKYNGVFASRVVKGKGLEDLIMALPIVLKEKPSFKLVVAGDGLNLSDCKELADNLGVRKNIEWLGFLSHDNVLKLFSDSEMLIFPSLFPEGMPMVMVEAMSKGLPVITTRTRFARSYLKENENVLFVENGKPDEIANKILLLLNNKTLQDKMITNNLEFVRQFSQERVGKEFSNIYFDMLLRGNSKNKKEIV